MGDALVELARRSLMAGDVPASGGLRPTVIVTMTLDQLTGAQDGTAMIRGAALHEPISVAAARRWACDAAMIPAVLGGKGQLLDLGRATRTANPAQRKALILRDGGCAFPGCDRPPAWTDAHHVQWWRHGGRTDLDNLVLLCGSAPRHGPPPRLARRSATRTHADLPSTGPDMTASECWVLAGRAGPSPWRARPRRASGRAPRRRRAVAAGLEAPSQLPGLAQLVGRRPDAGARGRRGTPRPSAVVSTTSGRSHGHAELVGLQLAAAGRWRRRRRRPRSRARRAGLAASVVDDVAHLEGDRLERRPRRGGRGWCRG